MHTLVRRLTALLLAALLALGGLTCAMADQGDWRDMLRSLYGLDEDTGQTPDASKDQPQFELPVTDPQMIVNYLALYGSLPDNFITKKEAMELGWDSRWNYLGDVAPGMSIGGDRFGNYEGQLPTAKGRTWFECDANYRGRARGAERVLYSSDGLYYYTNDHYRTFTQIFPEE